MSSLDVHRLRLPPVRSTVAWQLHCLNNASFMHDPCIPPFLLLTLGSTCWQAYYAQMSSALAMLTMFPGTRYYTEAASSTVATAISLGLPMVVTDRFVEVYNFISPRALVVADDSSHAAALERILAMSEAEWADLAMEVCPACRACRVSCELQAPLGFCIV